MTDRPITTVPSSPPAQRLFKITVRGRDVWLSAGRYTVGRSEQCSIPVDDARASRFHAQLTVSSDSVTVEDVGSANGTFLNGTRVRSVPVMLTEGDRVLVGSSEIVVSASMQPNEPAARRPVTIPPAHASTVPPSHRLLQTMGNATERADSLKLLGEVAERAMRAGHVEDAVRMAGPEVERVLGEIRARRSLAPSHLEWGLDHALSLAAATRAERWLELALDIAASDPRLLEREERMSTLERAATAIGPSSATAIRRWEQRVRSMLPSTAVTLLLRISRIADASAREDPRLARRS
jgi:pSer/pThr/pTyr-binding forkhead associated (FHA) protein